MLIAPPVIVVLLLFSGPWRRWMSSSVAAGGTISLLVETSRLNTERERERIEDNVERSLKVFQRYNPDVKVKWQLVPSDRMVQELDYRHRRGLGPDLLLITDTDLAALGKRGWIRPVSLDATERQDIRPDLVEALESDGQMLAVPELVFTRMACFDRQRMAAAPTSLDQLIDQAKAGKRFGFQSRFSELTWLYTSFGGELFPQGVASTNPSALLDFLRWLRLANLQPSIVFEISPQNLLHGFLAGRYQWVLCANRWLPSLQDGMSERLGLAALPQGPAGDPRAVVHMRLWAFGSQSNPRQQELALRLALFNINVVQQRTMAIDQATVLPVNPAIGLPFKAYPVLAVQYQQYKRGLVLTNQQFSDLYALDEQVQPLMDAVISGSKTPEAIAPRLHQVLRERLR